MKQIQDQKVLKLLSIDRNLYLGNLNNHSESSNVNLYSNSETNINVIVKINNNYLKTNDIMLELIIDKNLASN